MVLQNLAPFVIAAVLGVGLNVAVRLEDLPVELRAGAATLGYAPDAIEPTLARLLGALRQRLAEPATATLDAWRSRDALYDDGRSPGARGCADARGGDRRHGSPDRGALRWRRW